MMDQECEIFLINLFGENWYTSQELWQFNLEMLKFLENMQGQKLEYQIYNLMKSNFSLHQKELIIFILMQNKLKYQINMFNSNLTDTDYLNESIFYCVQNNLFGELQLLTDYYIPKITNFENKFKKFFIQKLRNDPMYIDELNKIFTNLNLYMCDKFVQNIIGSYDEIPSDLSSLKLCMIVHSGLPLDLNTAIQLILDSTNYIEMFNVHWWFYTYVKPFNDNDYFKIISTKPEYYYKLRSFCKNPILIDAYYNTVVSSKHLTISPECFTTC